MGCEAGDGVRATSMEMASDDVKDDVNDQDVSISLSSYIHGS